MYSVVLFYNFMVLLGMEQQSSRVVPHPAVGVVLSFVFCLVTLSISHYVVANNWVMAIELEGVWKEAVIAEFKVLF